VSFPRSRPIGLAALLAAAGLAALYSGALTAGFLNDDFLFLEEARTRSLGDALTRLGALGNFYRPLSRQLYFAVLAPIAGGSPLVFHVVNFAVFLAAAVLLFDLLRSLVPSGAAMAGVLYFTLLPFQRVNLIWISCSQDLLALAFALAALALHRRGRGRLAALAALGALASKEAALPLVAGLAAWDLAIEHRPWREALRRARPAWIVTLAWGAVLIAMRVANPTSAAFLRWDPGDFVAAYAHQIQSLIGLDHPAGLARGLFERGPSPIPLLLLGALALWVGVGGERGADNAGPDANDPRGAGAARRHGATEPRAAGTRGAIAFALAWLAAFGFVTGPVAHSWSAYYYTLSAVGAAVPVALALRRIDRWTWLALTAVLLWWHAGSTASRAFAVADTPWVWTSHLTSFYFERAAALTDTLSSQMRRLEPRPPRDTRFFFATLPPFAGFQMGNGALIRTLYRDPSLESYFYSQYSEATAADHPARFLYWDNRELRPLYDRRTTDPMFQVGTDLLLLDRPAGAAHAFRRGLAAGGPPSDHLYWLGWAELWQGHRAGAEQAWREWGAHDDSAAWHYALREAQTLHEDGADTVAIQRKLLKAIRFGIGRPEGHATLGVLLQGRSPKYAMLELMVATRLDPDDLASRRALALGLFGAHLDDAARRELAEYVRRVPQWPSDSEVAHAWNALERARGGRSGVIEY